MSPSQTRFDFPPQIHHNTLPKQKFSSPAYTTHQCKQPTNHSKTYRHQLQPDKNYQIKHNAYPFTRYHPRPSWPFGVSLSPHPATNSELILALHQCLLGTAHHQRLHTSCTRARQCHDHRQFHEPCQLHKPHQYHKPHQSHHPRQCHGPNLRLRYRRLSLAERPRR